MNDSEIRVAIAEACGKEVVYLDYVNDLNAIHEVEEKIFNQSDWDTYIGYLIEIQPKDQSPVRATARQRAEAFLRVLGKWKDV